MHHGIFIIIVIPIQLGGGVDVLRHDLITPMELEGEGGYIVA